MKITRKSYISGVEKTYEIDVTEEQMLEFNSQNRRKIQEIFPNIKAWEREFILTGINNEEWNQIF